jgi:hypothetical protein
LTAACPASREPSPRFARLPYFTSTRLICMSTCISRSLFLLVCLRACLRAKPPRPSAQFRLCSVCVSPSQNKGSVACKRCDPGTYNPFLRQSACINWSAILSSASTCFCQNSLRAVVRLARQCVVLCIFRAGKHLDLPVQPIACALSLLAGVQSSLCYLASSQRPGQVPARFGNILVWQLRLWLSAAAGTIRSPPLAT